MQGTYRSHTVSQSESPEVEGMPSPDKRLIFVKNDLKKSTSKSVSRKTPETIELVNTR